MTDVYIDFPTVDDVEVGDKGPEVTVENVDRMDFARYAGASGDFSPNHLDEKFVTEERGDPAVYAQGMLVMGFASHMVTDWFSLHGIRRFKARFIDRVWPGDTITVRGEIVDISEEGGRSHADVDVFAQNQDESTVLVCEVTVALPSGEPTEE